jgi:hypothetical protein
MAYRIWQGDGAAIAQSGTITTTAPSGSTAYSMTVRDEAGQDTAISYTSTGTGIPNFAAGLATAWNNSGSPAAQRATASAATTGVITFTADNAGVPFRIAATSATAVVGSYIPSVANAGPNDWNDPQNWEGGNIASAGNDIIVARGSGAILWNLDQSGSGNFATLTVEEGANGAIGGTDGASLQLHLVDSAAATTLEINGSGQIFLTIHRTATDVANGAVITTNHTYKPSAGQHGINLTVAQHASEVLTIPTLTVNRGNVGVHASDDDSACKITALNMGFVASAKTDANVTLGKQCHATTIEKTGGYITIKTTSSTVGVTLVQDEGTVVTEGSVVLTTMTLNGGSAVLKSTGTVTTLNINNASVDMTKDQRVGTVATVKLNKGGSLKKSTTAGTVTSIQSDDSVTFSAN